MRVLICLLPLTAALAQPAAPDKPDFALRYARSVEANFAEGKSFALGNAIDRDGILTRASLRLPRTRRLDWALAGMQARLELGRAIAADLRRGGSYRLLRMLQRGEERLARFRWIGSEGLTYHDLWLERRKDGLFRVKDIYDHRQGLWLSQQIRRSLLELLADDLETVPRKLLTPEERARFVAERQLRSIRQRWLAGKYELSMMLYSSLPRTVREDIPLLLERMQAAAKAGARALEVTAEMIHKAHPKLTSGDLMRVRLELGAGRHAPALQAIDDLAARLGADPYHDVLRSEAHLVADDTKAALARAQAALKADPKLLAARWAVLTIQLTAADHPGTAAALTALEKAGAKLPQLKGNKAFEAFLASEAGKAWRQARKGD